MVFSFKKSILSQIHGEKECYKMDGRMFIAKHFPFKLFFRHYLINLQQWCKVYLCQWRSKQHFCVVFSFKKSILSQIQGENGRYKKGERMFIEKYCPFKLFFRHYLINLQQWCKIYLCPWRFYKQYTVVFCFKKSILSQIQGGKECYNMGGRMFIAKHCPFKLFFRYYLINIQQWCKVYLC